ncbi:MAG TPA: glycoside hydrolase family 3 N-terminal domain-containing protein [Chloroflexaceae bacterium]|nr:glycoside hydrolase family 3 N-terminal domain-containing protein [Chloroflexaceae bacterium]
MELEDAIGQRLLLWFEGRVAPDWLLELVGRRAVGGVTLFRHLNEAPPAEVRALTGSLQAAARAAGRPPLLVCADQEGGQLLALAGTTAFPGNMALGAAGDEGLARRVGAAIGRELAALGVNVNYAPVCDVNVNPANPVIGVRSFGEDPALVARLAAALVEGLQSAGVAATAKHFPGHGDTAADSHHGLASLAHGRERLARVELPPFAAAFAAGARLVMSAHLALPALTGRADLPATLSPAVLRHLLRGELGFGGVVVSDALNMAGFGAGADFGLSLARAAAAGVDLLLLAEPNDHELAYRALLAAARDGRLAYDEALASARRVLALKGWLAEQAQPELDVVGCAEHRALAAEVAARAITLVRDGAGLLPLRLPHGARVVVATPALADLTPADTSSYERCELGRALRRHHPGVDELVFPADPGPDEVGALALRLAGYDLAVVGTIDAAGRPGQAALVGELLRRGVPLVAVALRLPYDLAAYPAAPTCLCTYSVLAPAMEALADALFGAAPLAGRLPVTVPAVA